MNLYSKEVVGGWAGGPCHDHKEVGRGAAKSRRVACATSLALPVEPIADNSDFHAPEPIKVYRNTLSNVFHK